MIEFMTDVFNTVNHFMDGNTAAKNVHALKCRFNSLSIGPTLIYHSCCLIRMGNNQLLKCAIRGTFR